MKIIHLADVHLDSPLKTNLDAEQRKKRKIELLETFSNMINYADCEGVDCILIAGDLFDSSKVSKTAMNAFISQVENHPDILFCYLRGNHDRTILSNTSEIPPNLLLFSDTWQKYVLKSTEKRDIVLSGVEYNGKNETDIYDSLSLNVRDFNIVMLHGQTAKYNMGDKTEYISLNRLQNRGIDYLALGHVHAQVAEALDGRGIYCFSGCLEGRGFDECGDKGFMLLDIDEDKGDFSYEFIPFARRNLYTIYADVSGCMNSEEMRERALDAVENVNPDRDSLINLVLTGSLDVECEKDDDYVLYPFNEMFYYAKISDETKLKVDFRQYAFDESLKGEFIRNVLASELSDEEKGEVIHYGLMALAGEEITR